MRSKGLRVATAEEGEGPTSRGNSPFGPDQLIPHAGSGSRAPTLTQGGGRFSRQAVAGEGAGITRLGCGVAAGVSAPAGRERRRASGGQAGRQARGVAAPPRGQLGRLHRDVSCEAEQGFTRAGGARGRRAAARAAARWLAPQAARAGTHLPGRAGRECKVTGGGRAWARAARPPDLVGGGIRAAAGVGALPRPTASALAGRVACAALVSRVDGGSLTTGQKM